MKTIFIGVCPPKHVAGPMTFHGHPIRHRSGLPVMAGDLIEGAEYGITEDGVLVHIDEREEK